MQGFANSGLEEFRKIFPKPPPIPTPPNSTKTNSQSTPIKVGSMVKAIKDLDNPGVTKGEVFIIQELHFNSASSYHVMDIWGCTFSIPKELVIHVFDYKE
jgi:hypothetical protein